MTQLPTKQNRTALNITTLERAAIYDVLQLKTALAGNPAVAASSGVSAVAAKAPDKNNKLVKVNTGLFHPKTGEPIPVVIIFVTLPYVPNTALRSGGNFLDATKDLLVNTVVPQALTATPSAITPILAIPNTEPSNVSLEKHFLWIVKQLKKGIIASADPKPYWMIECHVQDDLSEGLLTTKLQLPIDEVVYAETGNLISAVKETITTLTPSSNSNGGGMAETPVSPNPLNNDSMFGNNWVAGN